jgi:2-polyprenyl-3-methyl-5-hydroxy-6-metoxy-1,4-benzoquinol methylase
MARNLARDPAAVAAPARQADDWDRHWDEFGSASARNPAVAYRARLLARLVGDGGAPTRLLDVGVGSGDFLAFADATWPSAELAGVDVSEAGIGMVARRVPRAVLGVADLTAPGATPPALSGWATHAVCSEVLEHVDDPVSLLRNSAAMMAPGCRLVVTVPSGKMSAFDRHIGHRRHYTAELLERQLAEGGYDVEALLRAGFPFFNLYRAVIRARGEALIADVGAEHAEPSRAARLAMACFDGLFRLNLARSPWGLQLVARARYRG